MDISFQNLNLIDELLQSLSEEGYTMPTEIQCQAIPLILSGKDIIACAQTGTGKSAAFCLPLLQQLHLEKLRDGHTEVKALILAPTRELAVQISDSFAVYGRHTSLNHTAIFGGIPRKVQIDYLSRNIDILIATPGRLLDLVEKGFVSLSHVSHFVLDEADLMLNLGFLGEVEKVINLLPAERQSLLFSATIPYEIAKLAKSILKDPVHLALKPEEPAAIKIKQQLYFVDNNEKVNLLLHLLRMWKIDSAFVFVKTKQGAQTLSEFLVKAGFEAEAIHSERSQRERQIALERFKNKEVKFLVATDVVARGIDIENVSHVFNLDLPQECDSYIHRIGRTGRAGNDGVAVTFCDSSEIEKIRKIEKLIKQKIDVIEAHPYMSLALRRKLFDAEKKLTKTSSNKVRKGRR